MFVDHINMFIIAIKQRDIVINMIYLWIHGSFQNFENSYDIHKMYTLLNIIVIYKQNVFI